MKLINKNSLETGAIPIVSKKFKISKTAVSPVNVISSQYDPWDGLLHIKFRFDDALGRKYDIVGFYYSVQDTVVDGARYNEWIKSDVSLLQGEILNLESNKYGDNVISENLIVTHTVSIKISDLSLPPTDSFRIQFLSALSLDRAGLTYPCFAVKMWANEFLKTIE
jgi:hypothetical protein